MASDGGGKYKQKKNPASSKPYDRQSTLLGKLKDSVKDLLIPSWLSGTPAKQKKADDTATQHCHDEVTVGAQTGHVMPDWSHGSPFLAGTSSHISGSGYGSTVPGQLPSSNIPNFGFQPPNGDLQSDRPHSTPIATPPMNFNIGSQVQQMVVPNVTAGGMTMTRKPVSPVDTNTISIDQRYPDPLISHPQDFGITPIRPIMVSTGVKPLSDKPDAKRQRLWSPEPLRQGKPLVPPPRGKPAFNTLLFSTPSKPDTTGGTYGDSSFYVGKTRYGGASSAVRKSSMNTSLPYQSSLPLRKQVRATKMNSSFHATTSSTAQRILDTLERLSTPLEDAKKIPQGDSGNDSVLSFTPSSYRRQTSRCLTPITRPLQLPNRGPPTGQLQSTPQVKVARNRDRSRPLRSDSDQTLSITHETVSANESVNHVSSQFTSGSCKMKTKKFSQHFTGQQEDQEVVVPNLRTDFTLPLSSMAPIVLSAGCDKPKSQKLSATVSTKPCGSTPLKYTFSTPIEEKSSPIGSQLDNQADQGFKFSSPIHVSSGKASAAGAEGGTKLSSEPAVGAATPHVPMWSPQAMKPKAVSPDIGGTSSSFKSYTKWSGSQKEASVSPGFGLPVATSLKKGSVMDILGKNTMDTGKSQNTPLSAMFKKPAGSWECGTCMIQNQADVNKCIACAALKPVSKSNNAVPANSQSKLPSSTVTAPKPTSKTQDKGPNNGNVPLSELFKKPAGTWECGTCMIQNPPSAAKCAACETPKPGATTGPSAAAVPLSMLFKKPEGAWDCDTCMIRNKSSSNKCVACETPKPGAKTDAAPKTDNSLAAMFKKPEGSWECDTCMVQNSATALRCIACESSKPGLQSAGIVSKPPSTENTLVIAPGGGFSFALPSTSDTTTTTTGSAGFKFSNSSASVISSTPLSTSGFSFGSKNSLKDNSGSSTNNNSSTAKTMPLTGGFQISTPSSSSSMSNSINCGGFRIGDNQFGAPAVSTSQNVSIPTGGFQYKAPTVPSSTAPSVSSATTGFSLSVTAGAAQPTSGLKFGVPNSNDTSASKAGFSLSGISDSTHVSVGQTVSTPALSSLASNTKTSDIGGFQFAPTASSSSALSTTVVPLDKTSSHTSSAAPQQPTFSFGAAATTAKSDTSSSSSPFVFGASGSSVPQTNAIGLGMGLNLATQSTTLVNGGFGGGHEAKNQQQANNTGFGASSGGVGFGLNQNSIAKRLIDGGEHDGPSAKTSPGFGSAAKEIAVNGGFNFNANSGSFSSANSGSFAFGSSQPAQPKAGGFQFSSNPSGPAAPAAGFGFTAKPGQATQPAKPNEVSFSATPNFNFSATQSDGNALFQFGSKAAAEPPSASLFTFGAASSNAVPSQPSAPVFGAVSAAAAAAPSSMGNFNIGTADTNQRKMKKATRRIKPR